MRRSLGYSLLLSLAVAAVLLGGCKRQQHQDVGPELDRVKGDLEETRRKLTAAEKSLAEVKDQLALASAVVATAQAAAAAKAELLAQADAQRLALQTENDSLKRSDAMVFAAIRAVQLQGHSVTALNRYQQFVKDFPQSPLAGYANAAITELTSESAREAQRRREQFDPKRAERELVKRFHEGFSTLQELAPLFKKKTRAQVVALVGAPTQTFYNGTELGYDDRVIDGATGKKGMLVIGFEGGVVSSLRVNYAGRKFVP